MNTIIQQPYKGRWELSRDGVSIGHVRGDLKVGFIARDHLGNILGGRYETSVEALGAVESAAEIRDLEASWAMS